MRTWLRWRPPRATGRTPAPTNLPEGHTAPVTFSLFQHRQSVAVLTCQASETTALLLGRDPAACHYVIDDVTVSRQHVEVVWSAEFHTWGLIDRSRNGTWVNAKRLRPGIWTPVKGYVRLKVGHVEFTALAETGAHTREPVTAVTVSLIEPPPAVRVG